MFCRLDVLVGLAALEFLHDLRALLFGYLTHLDGHIKTPNMALSYARTWIMTR